MRKIFNISSPKTSKRSYRVTGSESGEDGLASLLAEPPDLVLLDLMLPGIDGMEVCRCFKQNASTRDIPVIIISAKGEESDIIAGLELGADDHGAWELAAMYSSIDLQDSGIDGGEEDNITPGLNWYATPNIRFMANYVRASTDPTSVMQ